jgi:hypothetical protein
MLLAAGPFLLGGVAGSFQSTPLIAAPLLLIGAALVIVDRLSVVAEKHAETAAAQARRGGSLLAQTRSTAARLAPSTTC